MNCVSCKLQIERLDLLQCSVCKDCYHYKCLNIQSAAFREKSFELKRTVKCDACSSVTRRVRMGDDTPVGVRCETVTAATATAATVGSAATAVATAALATSAAIGGELTAHAVNVDKQALDSGERIDMSELMKAVNESVTIRIDALEKTLLEKITAVISAQSTSELENDRLRKELCETKKKCVALESEIQTLRKRADNTSTIKKSQKPFELPLTITAPAAPDAATAAAVALEIQPATVLVEPQPQPSRPTMNYARAAMSTRITENIGQKEQDWNVVSNDKKKLNPAVKGRNMSVLQIKAVERKKYFHIWRLVSETTEEDLSEYVRDVLGKETFIKVDKLKHKSERGYASFRIGVTETDFDKLCNPDIWPRDAEYSEWIWFRDSSTHSHLQPQGQHSVAK